MSKPETPDTIYLIDTGDGIVWCDDPAPGADMEPEDAAKYIRADGDQLTCDCGDTYEHGTDGWCSIKINGKCLNCAGMDTTSLSEGVSKQPSLYLSPMEILESE